MKNYKLAKMLAFTLSTGLIITSPSTTASAGGNDGSNNWGTAGSNGGNVSFTAISETLSGDISCDGISTVDFYLTEKSSYTGSIIDDTSYTGNGGVSMNLASGTAWIVTESCSLISLNAADGAEIQDENGKTVTIQTTNGTVVSKGSGDITITTDSYSTEDSTSNASAISSFSVDRTEFSTWASANSSDNSSDSSDSSDNNTDSSSDNSDESSAEKPDTTKIKSITSKRTSVTLTWKKVSGCTGYIVYHSSRKNGTYKKVAILQKNRFKNTSLKKNKRYYYKIQAYTTTSSGKIYGNKSKAKSIKTKN